LTVSSAFPAVLDLDTLGERLLPRLPTVPESLRAEFGLFSFLSLDAFLAEVRPALLSLSDLLGREE